MRRLTVIAVGVVAYVLVGSATVFGQRPGKTLYEAAATGDAAQVKGYIDKKADLNAPDAQGVTALKYAVEAYSVDVVKLLLDAGANPNTKDRNGSTPLMTACMSGQKDVVEALLAGKADHAAKNPSGWTALHCAVTMGQYEITEVLIKAGADVNAKDNAGQTPLSVAQQRNQPEIADLLKQNGATAPVVQDLYGGYGLNGGASQAGGATGAASQRPADFVIDPNVIRKQLRGEHIAPGAAESHRRQQRKRAADLDCPPRRQPNGHAQGCTETVRRRNGFREAGRSRGED